MAVRIISTFESGRVTQYKAAALTENWMKEDQVWLDSQSFITLAPWILWKRTSAAITRHRLTNQAMEMTEIWPVTKIHPLEHAKVTSRNKLLCSPRPGYNLGDDTNLPWHRSNVRIRSQQRARQGCTRGKLPLALTFVCPDHDRIWNMLISY